MDLDMILNHLIPRSVQEWIRYVKYVYSAILINQTLTLLSVLVYIS
jgi:hypothetical protein